jgi:outer membrane protein OmpA-like peptidoglycan-associated protein
MGPLVNTSQNESYPFACNSGKLFFSSEGWPGLGGKDIFYTQEINQQWISPIHLDSLINSPGNDYGIVTDAEFTRGYFSSDREKNDDIFHFMARPVAFPSCDSMEKNNYCYLFYDEFRTVNDSMPVKYTWDFGNGIRKEGIRTRHCFPGPGQYSVKLIITGLNNPDSVINETPYEFELTEKEQVYIEAPDAILTGTAVTMNGWKTNLEGFKIHDYIWDLGEGFLTRGPTTSKVFDKKGEYKILLGVIGQKDTMEEETRRCVFKNIKVFDDFRDMAVQTTKEMTELDEFKEAMKLPENNKEALHLLMAEKKPDFLNIKTYLMNDLSPLCKENIIRTLGAALERTIKMNDQEINPESRPVLDQYFRILKENPGLRLYIALHTMQGTSSKSQEKTDNWAKSFNSYFSGKGITEKELSCKGYGSSRLKDDQNARELRDEKRAEFIFFQ